MTLRKDLLYSLLLDPKISGQRQLMANQQLCSPQTPLLSVNPQRQRQLGTESQFLPVQISVTKYLARLSVL